jgi:hypothetical protein
MLDFGGTMPGISETSDFVSEFLKIKLVVARLNNFMQ